MSVFITTVKHNVSWNNIKVTLMFIVLWLQLVKWLPFVCKSFWMGLLQSSRLRSRSMMLAPLFTDGGVASLCCSHSLSKIPFNKHPGNGWLFLGEVGEKGGGVGLTKIYRMCSWLKMNPSLITIKLLLRDLDEFSASGEIKILRLFSFRGIVQHLWYSVSRTGSTASWFHFWRSDTKT